MLTELYGFSTILALTLSQKSIEMTQPKKLPDIRNFTRQELRLCLNEASGNNSKIQAYRADQIFYWLYRSRVNDFEKMDNIGRPTREFLQSHFRIGVLKSNRVLRSRDGSLKYRLLLED